MKLCCTKIYQHLHGSIKSSTAGVDEASDHSVEDEGQDLRLKRDGKSKGINASH